MTVYLDILFLYNLIINSLLLYISGYILKLKIKWYKVLLGGVFGSLYGIFTILCNIHPFLNSLLKFLSAFVMIRISYRQSLRGYIKLLCTLFVSSFCLCGFYMAFSSFANIQATENKLFLNLGYPYIFLIFLFFIFTALLFSEACMIKVRKGSLYKTTEIFHKGKKAKLYGFVDTGNTLCTPEGFPVAFVNKKYTDKFLNENHTCLSFSTVGGNFEKNGFYPDKMLIDGKEVRYFIVPIDEDFENNFDILLGGIECLD